MFGSGDASRFIIKLRGLPFSTTVQNVIDFLGDVEIVNGKAGVHLTEVRPGRPSGECFVELANQTDVDEALKKDKEHMGKRYIEVFSSDRQEMEWAINASQTLDNGFEVPFISDEMGVVKLRGLPFGCTKEEVTQFFDGLQVTGVHLLSDGTGRATGEAFVNFSDIQTAQRALEKDRETIGHRYIEVFMSGSEEMRAAVMRYDSGPPRGGFRGPHQRPTPYDRFPGPRFPRGMPGQRGGFSGGSGGWSRGGGLGGGVRGGRGGGGGGGHNVHMRGLPFRATPQDIAFFFKPLRPININILFDNNYRPSGEADVEFDTHEDAMKAMRKDKSNMEHRYIELFLNSAQGGGVGGFKSNFRGNFRNNY